MATGKLIGEVLHSLPAVPCDRRNRQRCAEREDRNQHWRGVQETGRRLDRRRRRQRRERPRHDGVPSSFGVEIGLGVAAVIASRSATARPKPGSASTARSGALTDGARSSPAVMATATAPTRGPTAGSLWSVSPGAPNRAADQDRTGIISLEGTPLRIRTNRSELKLQVRQEDELE